MEGFTTTPEARELIPGEAVTRRNVAICMNSSFHSPSLPNNQQSNINYKYTSLETSFVQMDGIQDLTYEEQTQEK